MLLLSLESTENVVSVLSSGTSDRCTLCPVSSTPRGTIAQPPSRQGKKKRNSFSSKVFTAIMWACHARVGSGHDAEERKYAEGFLLEKATTKRTGQKTLQAKKSISTAVL